MARAREQLSRQVEFRSAMDPTPNVLLNLLKVIYIREWGYVKRKTWGHSGEVMVGGRSGRAFGGPGELSRGDFGARASCGAASSAPTLADAWKCRWPIGRLASPGSADWRAGSVLVFSGELLGNIAPGGG